MQQLMVKLFQHEKKVELAVLGDMAEEKREQQQLNTNLLRQPYIHSLPQIVSTDYGLSVIVMPQD